MTSKSQSSECGFTLVEIAIVLLIVSLLLGSILVPLGGAFEQSQRKTTRVQLEEINKALIGFAVANERLPCPASGTSSGVEDPLNGGDCANTDADNVAQGFVPATTLALIGETNIDGLLLDSWGEPIRYSVSQVATDPAEGPDFTTQGQMRVIGMANLTPNIVICIRAASVATCPGADNSIRANQIPAIAFSLGKDWSEYSGADQLANAGEGISAGIFDEVIIGTSGRAYPIAANGVFVSKSFNQVEGDEKFDDVVIWLSENILYTRMIQGGVLP